MPEKEKMMERNQAIQMCRDKGLPLTDQKNFGSRNKTGLVYWINPNIDRLHHDWWIILNDDLHCRLYVFCVPANTIQQHQIVLRVDKPHLIDLQIRFNDLSFEDTRSHIHFKPWLRTTIPYPKASTGNQP